jgi:hypothetical protein
MNPPEPKRILPFRTDTLAQPSLYLLPQPKYGVNQIRKHQLKSPHPVAYKFLDADETY